MDIVNDAWPSDLLGLALLAVGAFVAFKAAKLVIKLLMVVVIAAGLYLVLT